VVSPGSVSTRTASNPAFDASTKTGSFDCTWSDDSGLGMADVSASVTDDDGDTGSDTIHVTVANVGDIQPLAEANRAFERKQIENALQATKGNKTQAARLLGVPLRTFMEKIKRHGLG